MHPPDTPRGTPLATAVRLNLGRALVGAGRWEEATNLYGELEFSAELDGHPQAFISYAVAQARSGNPDGARLALEAALEAGADGAMAAEAAAVLLRVEAATAGCSGVLAALQRLLPALAQRKAHLAAVQRLWLAAAASAVVAQDGELLGLAAHGARQWAADADAEEPAFLSELLGLQGVAALASGQQLQALRLHSRALHLCPWDAASAVRLAGAAVQAQPTRAAAALRLLAAPLVARAARDQGAALASGQPMALAALEAGTEALLARCASSARLEAERQLSVAAQAVLANPACHRTWYLAVLAASQRAAACGLRNGYTSALRWCRAAGAVLQRRQSQAGGGMQAQLELCASEALLRLTAQPEALAAVERAAELASAAGDVDLQAAAQRQRGRCLWAAGDSSSAEAALKQALAQRPDDAATVIDLSRLLSEAGRGDEAAAVLETTVALAGAGGPGHQVLQLQLAQQLAALDLEQAKAAAAAADVEASGRGLSGEGSTAKLLLGAIALRQAQQALASGAAEAATPLLGEARRVLLASVAAKDSAVARALLAQVEALGSMRRKQERVEANAAQVGRILSG